MNTSADPSLAKTISRAHVMPPIIYNLNVHWTFEHLNTLSGLAWFMNIAPVFRAFIVSLFQVAAANGLDYIHMVGPDANTPPVAPRFDAEIGVTAWVYDTPVCGSVPLMSTVHSAQTDHYYTTDADENSELASTGWGDSGVIAYILPLPTSDSELHNVEYSIHKHMRQRMAREQFNYRIHDEHQFG